MKSAIIFTVSFLLIGLCFAVVGNGHGADLPVWPSVDTKLGPLDELCADPAKPPLRPGFPFTTEVRDQAMCKAGTNKLAIIGNIAAVALLALGVALGDQKVRKRRA